LIEAHSLFAGISQNIFIALTILYLAQRYAYAKDTAIAKAFPPILQKIIEFISMLRKKLFLAPILAVLGLAAITITGALGGAIVHGPGVDPFVQRAVTTFVSK
jgi:hypothetical protein